MELETMKNQTIDGVGRETLAIALGLTCHGYKNRTDQAVDRQHARDKLRAMLDAPTCKTPSGAACPGDGVGPCKKCAAAQPQGEPVAHMPVERCYDVRAKMIIAFNEAKKAGGDLDDALDAAYKSALRYSPNPMNAEQPAPVAEHVGKVVINALGCKAIEFPDEAWQALPVGVAIYSRKESKP
ncbi:hypothetical protein [uncultured Sphingomonas sp.]|uniref:hypothetical protein n=1 Tax=uncultured Sphingomonas sp. TaxID=158754 RepID=UPI00259372FC|nr:hypothetical protein [uncultured Sphingomonas sp.]